MKYFVSILVFAAVILTGTLQASAEDAVIKQGSKVTFDYTLTVDGNVMDTSAGKAPLAYTQGDKSLIPGLTRQMEGLKAGDERVIEVFPDEAYGQFEPAGIKEVPTSSLPENIKPEVGMILEVQDDGGRTFPARIKELKGDKIVLDLNHPLAGKKLIFNVKVVSVS